MSGTRRLDVVAIGNALVDVLTHETDDVRRRRTGVEPGAMTLVDAARADEIYAAMGPARRDLGRIGGEHAVGVASFGGTRRVHRPGRRRRVRRGLRATTCAPPACEFDAPPATDGSADRPLPRDRHARRRAHDEHVPRRAARARPGRRRRRPDRARRRSPTSRATSGTSPTAKDAVPARGAHARTRPATGSRSRSPTRSASTATATSSSSSIEPTSTSSSPTSTRSRRSTRSTTSTTRSHRVAAPLRDRRAHPRRERAR